MWLSLLGDSGDPSRLGLEAVALPIGTSFLIGWDHRQWGMLLFNSLCTAVEIYWIVRSSLLVGIANTLGVFQYPRGCNTWGVTEDSRFLPPTPSAKGYCHGHFHLSFCLSICQRLPESSTNHNIRCTWFILNTAIGTTMNANSTYYRQVITIFVLFILEFCAMLWLWGGLRFPCLLIFFKITNRWQAMTLLQWCWFTNKSLT